MRRILVLTAAACLIAPQAFAGSIFSYRCAREDRDFGTFHLGAGKETPAGSAGHELVYLPDEQRFETAVVRRGNFQNAIALPVAGEEKFMARPTEYVLAGGKKAYLYSGLVCPACRKGKLDRTALGFWD